jgi:hypothetical protein
MRIFTDINLSKERGKYHLGAILQALILERNDLRKNLGWTTVKGFGISNNKERKILWHCAQENSRQSPVVSVSVIGHSTDVKNVAMWDANIMIAQIKPLILALV